MEKLYLNVENGFMIKSEVTEHGLRSAVGKKVNVEFVEMGCFLIEGKYYHPVDRNLMLVELKVMPEEDIVDAIEEEEKKVKLEPERLCHMADVADVLDMDITKSEYKYLEENWKAFVNDPFKYQETIVVDFVVKDLTDKRQTDEMIERWS